MAELNKTKKSPFSPEVWDYIKNNFHPYWLDQNSKQFNDFMWSSMNTCSALYDNLHKFFKFVGKDTPEMIQEKRIFTRLVYDSFTKLHEDCLSSLPAFEYPAYAYYDVKTNKIFDIQIHLLGEDFEISEEEIIKKGLAKETNYKHRGNFLGKPIELLGAKLTLDPNLLDRWIITLETLKAKEFNVVKKHLITKRKEFKLERPDNI